MLTKYNQYMTILRVLTFVDTVTKIPSALILLFCPPIIMSKQDNLIVQIRQKEDEVAKMLNKAEQENNQRVSKADEATEQLIVEVEEKTKTIGRKRFEKAKEKGKEEYKRILVEADNKRRDVNERGKVNLEKAKKHIKDAFSGMFESRATEKAA